MTGLWEVGIKTGSGLQGSEGMMEVQIPSSGMVAGCSIMLHFPFTSIGFQPSRLPQWLDSASIFVPMLVVSSPPDHGATAKCCARPLDCQSWHPGALPLRKGSLILDR